MDDSPATPCHLAAVVALRYTRDNYYRLCNIKGYHTSLRAYGQRVESEYNMLAVNGLQQRDQSPTKTCPCALLGKTVPARTSDWPLSRPPSLETEMNS